MLELIPSARVGHIGLYREPKTRVAIEYYFKVPEDVTERDVLVVDPMLATGNSAVAAVQRLKEAGAKSLKFVCLLAAPEGLAHFHEEHPECRSTRPPLMPASTTMAISSPAWGMREIGSLARNDPATLTSAPEHSRMPVIQGCKRNEQARRCRT